MAAVYVKDMYALSDDTNIITEDLTRAFIDDLKQQLAANPHLFGGRNLTAHVDLNKCRKVARDILNYLRYTRSVAILQLLRRFSAGGGTLLALTDVDPNELRAEVGILMNVTTLNSYYAKMSNKGCDRKKRNITAPNVEAILTNSLVSAGVETYHPLIASLWGQPLWGFMDVTTLNSDYSKMSGKERDWKKLKYSATLCISYIGCEVYPIK